MGNNKYKILIVEDEANIRSFIKANLETSDYQVLCAETCELGMMMYASHHPDLIVLDLGLPDRFRKSGNRTPCPSLCSPPVPMRGTR